MTIYQKTTWNDIIISLTVAQKVTFQKVFKTWNDTTVETDDIELAKLPAIMQTKLLNFITKQGYE